MKSAVPFIVIDGIGGAGKSTQVQLLRRRLEKGGTKIVFTREPGGTPIAEMLRGILLNNYMDPFAQACLMWGGRSDAVQRVIAPHLNSGTPVISDRSDSSTYAYQIIAHSAQYLDEHFWVSRKHAFGDYAPTAYIFFDIPVEVAISRIEKRAEKNDIFDENEKSFFYKLHDGMHEFANKIKEKTNTPVYFVDASKTIDEVHDDVYAIVADIMGWS